MVSCQGCSATQFLERGTVKSSAPSSERAQVDGSSRKFLPCHKTDEEGCCLSVIECVTCGPFLVPHGPFLYADENGNCQVVECECEGCVEASQQDEFGEDAEGMKWLDKCDREERCFECGVKHRGNAEEYWIPHPQDESDQIQGVLFCYDCYDSVRNARRRDLGMSHYSSDEDSDERSDSGDGDSENDGIFAD